MQRVAVSFYCPSSQIALTPDDFLLVGKFNLTLTHKLLLRLTEHVQSSAQTPHKLIVDATCHRSFVTINCSSDEQRVIIVLVTLIPLNKYEVSHTCVAHLVTFTHNLAFGTTYE